MTVAQKTGRRAFNRHGGGDGALVLGRAIHPPWNEGTRVIAGDVAHLAAGRRDVRTLSLTEPDFMDEVDERIDVEHLPAPGGGRLSEYSGLPRMASRARFAAATGDFGVAHLVGVPLVLAPLLRRMGVKVVVHVTLSRHAYQSRVDRFRALAAARAYGRYVDAWACAADPIRDDLLQAGYPAERLFVVPPGIDLDLFRAVDRGAARRSLGLAEDPFTVLYMGTVSPLRFPAPQIAAALADAAADVPGLSLAVVAPVRSHGYNVPWMDENVRRGLSGAGVEAVIELRDVDHADKPAVYCAADAVLVPFAAPVAVEPPLTLLEAMACEATVIAAPHANRSRVIDHGRNGLVFEDAQGLADAVRHAASLGRAGAGLGMSARTTVSNRFSAAATLAALDNLWEALGV
jgi:glycosyltransferase involved in cell wall biosynthesis